MNNARCLSKKRNTSVKQQRRNRLMDLKKNIASGNKPERKKYVSKKLKKTQQP